MHDQHLVTKGKGSVIDPRLKKEKTLIASLTNENIKGALKYFYRKATMEIFKCK